MTYADVCAELLALGGVEIAPGVFVMPTPELRLTAEQDYTVRDVTYAGAVVAQAWTRDDNYVATFYVVSREQVAGMLPALSAEAAALAGGTS
jgi:hypothetical protein